MTPLLRSTMAGTKARMTFATPRMLTETTFANSSAGTFQSGAGALMRPALLIRKSGGPMAPRTRSAQRLTLTGLRHVDRVESCAARDG